MNPNLAFYKMETKALILMLVQTMAIWSWNRWWPVLVVSPGSPGHYKYVRALWPLNQRLVCLDDIHKVVICTDEEYMDKLLNNKAASKGRETTSLVSCEKTC